MMYISQDHTDLYTIYGNAETLKGMEHVPNIFMLFDKYLFLEVINILI